MLPKSKLEKLSAYQEAMAGRRDYISVDNRNGNGSDGEVPLPVSSEFVYESQIEGFAER